MKQASKARMKEEHGEIMLEASIIFVPILILLFVLLSLAFFYYQTAIMDSVANEVAADVAQNYKFHDIAVGKDTLTLHDVESTKMYRTTFGKNSLRALQEARGKKYAEWRVPITSLGFNPDKLDVECEIIGSGIGRAYVKVRVAQKTDFFLSGILDMTGITEKNTMFAATAYAECMDLTGYTSMINFTQYTAGKLKKFNGIAGLYVEIKDLVKQLQQLQS